MIWLRRTATVLALARLLLAAGGVATIAAAAADSDTLEVATPAVNIRLIEEGRSLFVDLASTVRLATANSTEILLAKARYDEAAALRDSSLASFLPRLSQSFTAQKIDGQIQASFGELGRRSFSTLVPAARLEIGFNAGSALFDALAARKTLRATGAAMEQANQKVLAQVAIRYFELQRAFASIYIAEQAVRASRELARVAAAREARGAGLKADVKRAEARVGDDEGHLTQAATEFRRASVALAVTLELDAAVTLFPASPAVKQMRLVDPEESLEGLIELALRQRPDLGERALRVDAAESKAKGAWAEVFGPDLYGFFEESAIGRSIGTLDTRQLYGGFVGVTLRPESISSARAARARVAMAKLEEQRMQRRIAGQVIATRESVLGAREQVEAAMRRVHAAEASLRLSQARFKGGVGISLEVLEAQASLTRSRDSLLSAITRYNTGQVALLQATGSLSGEALRAPAASSQMTGKASGRGQ